MSKTTRGRPTKNTNVLVVNDLLVEYLNTKTNTYDSEISYFKIIDTSFRVKLKSLFGLNDDGSLKMPIWITEKQEHILKVKSKFIVNHKDLIERDIFVVNISFEYYNMEQANIKGYYAKITKVMAVAPPPGIIDADSHDDDN
jgi:hypothetical protein